MQISIAYAGFLTLLWVLSVFNHRIAYGVPREVDFEEEVVLITGGASGLGRLIADFYAMRGASVAVLDVKKPDDDEMMGIRYYQCDVGDRKQVELSVAKIKEDVCRHNSLLYSRSRIAEKLSWSSLLTFSCC
jgi:NAD(P)-dependent dehydrogenase (short-subunit alcohol dehydrogenase family)